MPPIVKTYSDFSLDFFRNPITGDIPVIRDIEAVKEAVKNLVLAATYSRPYREGLGSNVAQLLFENISPIARTQIRDAIRNVIIQYEPRVTLISVEVNVNEDENGYDATITFAVDKLSQVISVDLFLEKVRG